MPKKSLSSLSIIQTFSAVIATALIAGCGTETPSQEPSSVAPSSSSSAPVVSSTPASSTPVSSSSVAEVSSEVISSSSAPAVSEDLPLVIAINSGGSATTFDGIEFSADKYASGGTANTASGSVTGGEIYQSERYGSVTYDIPVTGNGDYTVELHFAEIYQDNAGARSFDVQIEGNTVIEDLDIYAEVGRDNGYTETFENIAVTDNTVTIKLVMGQDNPTIAGLAVYSNDGEVDTSVVIKPDFSKYSAYTQEHDSETRIESNHATGHVGDFFFTHWKDGGSTSLTMDTDGSFNVTWTGGGYNYVGGPGWHYGDLNRVIGYRFDQDGGASYITLYGWGYDKDMPKSDPAHLVEYYILSRWTFDPSTSGTYGTTFTSGGVEYSTYRSTRSSKPSINSTSTFYQYWSRPTQPQALGQDHKIIFADHVAAWASTGWNLPNTDNLDASDDPTYQVMAVEVFNPGSGGSASGQVWDASGE